MINDVLSDPSFDPEWFNLDPSVYYETGDNSCGFIPDLPNIVDEVDRDEFGQPNDPKDGSPMLGLESLTDRYVLSRSDRHPQSYALRTRKVLTEISNSNLWAPEMQLTTSAIITDEREHEMAYLIRHFTEAIGPWYANIIA